MDVLRALGTKIEVDGRNAAGNRWPLSRKAKNRFGRQFRIDALLHDRISVASRRADHADRAKILPAAPGRTVARRARCNGRAVRIRERLPADCNYPRSAPGRQRSSSPERCRNGSPVFSLLAPFAKERTVIEVEGELNERPYIALTAEMMRAFGLHVHMANDCRRFEVEPEQQAHPATVELPPDIGSAAFGLAVTRDPSIQRALSRLAEAARASFPTTPKGAFMEIVREMGLPMAFDEQARAVRVKHDGIELRGVHVDCRDIPDMLPILSTLGTFAKGETVLENIAHVRLKESDRVAAMLQLNRMGGHLELHDDRLVARGVSQLFGTHLSSFNDHRILMSLAVAASRAEGQAR